MDDQVRASRAWVRQGTSLCREAITALGDSEFAQDSSLPGWSRAHVVAHLALNARAHLNLVHWARTGIETPMYASPAERAEGIERMSHEPPRKLREEFEDSARAWDEAFDAVQGDEWSAMVKSAQGQPIPLSIVPWLRSREVMIHALDLRSSVTWADIPDDYAQALITNIAKDRSRRADGRALTLDDNSRQWEIAGAGVPLQVTSTTAGIAAYLSGRPGPTVHVADADVPHLTAWL